MAALSDPRDLLARRVPAPGHTLRYGPHPEHVADVWLPDDEPRSLVLFLHGGFWREAHDRHYSDPCAHALARSGHLVANVEYRRVGGAGGNPETFDDIARAVDVLPDQVRSLDGPATELPVVLAGHSAGGHLALWASVRHLLPTSARWHTPDPAGLRGVLVLAGVCSVATALAEGIGENAAAELLADRGDLDLIDPGRIGAAETPTALVHGRLDHRVPVEYSTRHRAALANAGTPTWLEVSDDAGHFEIVDPAADAWSTVLTGLDWLTGS